MKRPKIVSDRMNRRVCVRGDGLTKKMAVYIATKKVGPSWTLVTSSFETDSRINVFFQRNGTFVDNPRNS